MSRQNKVNPGMYTQRGRLAQDDAAREIAKQRSVGSEHTWQPVQRDSQPRLTPQAEGADNDADAIAAPNEATEKKPRLTAKAKSKTAARKTAKAPKKRMARAKKTAAPTVRAKSKSARTKAKAKSAKRRKS